VLGWLPPVLSLAALLLALFSLQSDRSLAAPVSVLATVETTPVPDATDAADDMAIWIHPTNPALSTVLGTDKLASGGLGVYDLAGTSSTSTSTAITTTSTCATTSRSAVHW
jgi:3-phytase